MTTRAETPLSWHCFQCTGTKVDPDKLAHLQQEIATLLKEREDWVAMANQEAAHSVSAPPQRTEETLCADAKGAVD